MSCCDDCAKSGSSGCGPALRCGGSPPDVDLFDPLPDDCAARARADGASGRDAQGLGAAVDRPDLDVALQALFADNTICQSTVNANVTAVQQEYNAQFPGSAIPVTNILDPATLAAINGYLASIGASYSAVCQNGQFVQGPAVQVATPTPWGTYALVGGAAVALAALGTLLYERSRHTTLASVGRFKLMKANPAHEDIVGRRIELHPGHDLWARGARYGVVTKMEGDTCVIRMDHPQVRKLIRVHKERVTLR